MSYLMIVDDDEDFAHATAMVLRNEGHEVHIELTTGDVLDLLAERRPDLLILDVMFPEDNAAGLKLAQKICGRGQEGQTVPVMMLTAVSDALPLGFSRKAEGEALPRVAGFIEKPVEFEALVKSVSSVLQRPDAPAGNRDRTEQHP